MSPQERGTGWSFRWSACAVLVAFASLALSAPPSVMPNEHQRARVGTRCEVHHWERLRLDLVPIHYGFYTSIPGRNSEEELERFPNAWPHVGGGCVRGRQKLSEVAYCRACRAAYGWDLLGQVVTAPLRLAR